MKQDLTAVIRFPFLDLFSSAMYCFDLGYFYFNDFSDSTPIKIKWLSFMRYKVRYHTNALNQKWDLIDIWVIKE